MSKLKMTQIKGVILAMMASFDREENVDIQRTRRMVDFILDHGADGLYLTGGTGECFTMTTEGWNLVTDTVIDQVKGRALVIIHAGSIGTKKLIELAKRAYEAEADAILSVPPFHRKFRADDTYGYYKDVSEAMPPPTVVYNIQLAGFMGTGLLLEPADLPNVHGLKHTARSHGEMGYLKEKPGSDFMIHPGCDEMAFSDMYAEMDGIIGSPHNLFPGLYKKILVKVEASDTKGGMRLQKIMDEVIFAILKYDLPSVLHGMMNRRGLEPGYSREPFCNYEGSELTGLKEEVFRVKGKCQAEELDMFHF